MTKVEATYLAWINIADLGLNDVEAHFESHGPGISDGAQFGHPDYIRFNFACPDAMLNQGSRAFKQSLEHLTRAHRDLKINPCFSSVFPLDRRLMRPVVILRPAQIAYLAYGHEQRNEHLWASSCFLRQRQRCLPKMIRAISI